MSASASASASITLLDRVRRERLLARLTDLTDERILTLDDTDSEIGSESSGESESESAVQSETQSVTSSVFTVERKYGRTYHGYHAGAYACPNDAVEIERLNTEHAIFRAVFWNRNYLAPLRPRRVKRMLDIGCGTGKWCIEMAKAFPDCKVEGIDLSSIQPQKSVSNVDFYVDDIRRPVWYDSVREPYDYIHTRTSLGIYPDFREIIQKGFNNLNPGGWMESQEIYSKIYCGAGGEDNESGLPPTHPLMEWTQFIDDAAMIMDRPLRIANKIKRWYQQAGFLDVHEEVFAIPINDGQKDDRLKLLGWFWNLNMKEGIYGWTVDTFVNALGWSPVEVEVYLARLRNSLDALAAEGITPFYKVYVVWGRKPREGEAPSTEPKPSHWPQRPTRSEVSSIFTN